MSQNTRKVLDKDRLGNPVCPVVDLHRAMDGTMTKMDLRALVELMEINAHSFWETYLIEKCGFSTFKTWYYDSYPARVPDFLLVFLTTAYPHLYPVCREIYSGVYDKKRRLMLRD